MTIGDIGVRDARPDEAEALLALWRLADAVPGLTDTLGDVQKLIATPSARLLVVESDGHLIGSIIGTFDGWRGNIYRLAVHPDYRRQGVARALVAEVEKRLTRQGARRIT